MRLTFVTVCLVASLVDLNNSILLPINVEWESNKILIVFRLREYLIMIKT